MSPDVTPYDALLLVSFGGPEKPEDVVPFLENVTRGRGIPRERLEEVGEHYFLFGGRSPINDLNREFLAAIREDLRGRASTCRSTGATGTGTPTWPTRSREMRDDGVTRAACFVTSAYSSYSACRQYRENLADASAAVAGRPGSTSCATTSTTPGSSSRWSTPPWPLWRELPDEVREDAHLAFVTHSIPLR